MLEDFLATTVADLQALESARRAGDLAGLARQAHKIKGAARMVGAAPLGEAAGAVEAAASAGDWAQVLPGCTDVTTAVERLRRYVAARFQP